MGRTSGSGNGGDGGNADLASGFVGIVRSSHQIVVQVAMPHGSFYSPLAVSPESMTRSAPSVIGLATSEISAGIGRGFLMIDFIIWVAQMIGTEQ